MLNKSSIEWQNIQTLQDFQIGQAVIIIGDPTQYGFIKQMRLNPLGEIILGIELILGDNADEQDRKWLHPASTRIKKVVDIEL